MLLASAMYILDSFILCIKTDISMEKVHKSKQNMSLLENNSTTMSICKQSSF